ncbi:MAG TPA: D-alanine--D-alanine ligase [Candidatus Brocadiia bacterium]|nr:D-alanine--D-alanine ligase [Candidatus Brocadiia bacterium]
MKTSLNVAVLFGGPSSEREVSRRSGRAVCDSLSRQGHYVTPVDVFDITLPEVSVENTDVAFLAMHGAFGEDGQAQTLLEERGIPYTGSGPVASKLAMDKVASKWKFRAYGMKTPDWTVATHRHSVEELEELCSRVGYPCVVKPRRNGSSVGVGLANDAGELADCAAQAFEIEDEIILEAYAAGREFTVGILDDSPLPVIEVVPASDFFDYNAKYVNSDTKYLLDVDLDADEIKLAQEAARKAHLALGCCGMSRVDMIRTGPGIFEVLEVNTIPGMTERSLLPKAAGKAGIDFARLCELIVELALKRPAAQRAAPAISHAAG